MLVTLSTMGWGIYTVVIRPASRKYGAASGLPRDGDLSTADALLRQHRFPRSTRQHGMRRPGPPSASSWSSALSSPPPPGTIALGHMESSIAGVFLYVQPVVAAAGGIMLLGESLTWPLVLGGSLIIAGVAIAQFGPLMWRTRLRAPPRAAMETP
jgi:hypothetical protein